MIGIIFFDRAGKPAHQTLVLPSYPMMNLKRDLERYSHADILRTGKPTRRIQNRTSAKQEARTAQPNR